MSASPFNGKWGLNYCSDMEAYFDAFDMGENFRVFVRKALSDRGPDRMYEEYSVDNEAGTVSRKIVYGKNPARESNNIPFESWQTTKFFDGTTIKFMFGREGGNNNMIVRFEIGNNDKTHSMVVSEVCGDAMIETYTCRGKTFVKKFDRLP